MGTNVIIAYKGQLVDGGTMDVHDLGSALVSFGDLIDECNKVLNKDDSKVVVKVNADFRAGSFEVVLDISRSIVSQMQSIFNDTVSVEQIAIYVGLISGGITIGCGLIDFMKWLRGRKIDKITNNNNGTLTVIVGNDNIVINQQIINLYTSVPVRDNLNKVLAPLDRDGIDGFEARTPKGDVVSSISKDEKPYFGVTVDDEELTNTSQHDTFVKILSVSFEDLKWRLRYGEEKIYADIKDMEFADKVRDGKIAFANGDILKVCLEVHQVANKGIIKTNYSVLKVYQIAQRPREVKLPFDDEEQ